MAVYADLAHQYRTKITTGELPPGHRFPIEQELAEQHGVSIATVSRCMKLLKTEGLVYTTHAGTFVGPRPEDPRTIRSEREQIRCANTRRCNNVLEWRRGQADPNIFITRVGWIWRGSVQGRLYFCHQCAPGVVERESKGSDTPVDG